MEAKTPMQELIDWLDMSINNCELAGYKNLIEPLESTKTQAKRLLKREQSELSKLKEDLSLKLFLKLRNKVINSFHQLQLI